MALQMMIAADWLEGWEVLYFINNLHIHDKPLEQLEELPVSIPRITNHAWSE